MTQDTAHKASSALVSVSSFSVGASHETAETDTTYEPREVEA